MTNEELAKHIYSGQNELVGELYLNNKGIIYKYAKAFYNRHSERCCACGVELEDLLHQAFFVLPEAVSAYIEQTENYKFTAYLKYPLLKCFNTLVGYRTKTGHKEPLNNYTSLNAPIADSEDDTCLIDTIPDEKAEFESNLIENINRSGLMAEVKKALKDYNGYFDIIFMKYVLNMTQRSIAAKLGCSESNIHQIIAKALRILRHPRSKYIAAYRNDIVGASYHMGGLSRYRKTNTSSVEWAVLKFEQEETENL